MGNRRRVGIPCRHSDAVRVDKLLQVYEVSGSGRVRLQPIGMSRRAAMLLAILEDTSMAQTGQPEHASVGESASTVLATTLLFAVAWPTLMRNCPFVQNVIADSNATDFRYDPIQIV